jgi:hypothetical protein
MKVWVKNRAKGVLARLALIGVGLMIALLAIEGGLRLIPSNYVDLIIERSSQRLQLYRLDSRIGWTPNPHAETVITTRDERSIPITMNSLGLRDSEHSYQKPPGVFRGLMLGDSFTEALDVHLTESYPYRVEACLGQQLAQPVEIINGGVSGYNTADEYLFYHYEGVRYNPDLVLLLLYVGNDFAGLERDITKERLVAGFGGYRFSLEDGQLKKVWVSWETPADGQTPAGVLFLRNYSRLYRILAHPESKIYGWYRDTVNDWLQRLAPSTTGSDDDDETQSLPWHYYLHFKDFANNPASPPKLREIWAVFLAVIRQLRGEVEANRGQLVVVIIPTDYQVSPAIRDKVISRNPALSDEQVVAQWDLDEPNLTIVRELERQAIPVLDLLPYFEAHYEAGGADLYFEGFVDEHLNRDGQKLAADVICDWLMQNSLVHLSRRIK